MYFLLGDTHQHSLLLFLEELCFHLQSFFLKKKYITEVTMQINQRILPRNECTILSQDPIVHTLFFLTVMGNFHFGHFLQTPQLVYIPKLPAGEAVLMPIQMTKVHVAHTKTNQFYSFKNQNKTGQINNHIYMKSKSRTNNEVKSTV